MDSAIKKICSVVQLLAKYINVNTAKIVFDVVFSFLFNLYQRHAFFG